MQFGMAIPAVLCLFLGVAPSLVIPFLDYIPQSILGVGLAASANESGWLWLTPISSERASYAAPVVFIGLAVIVGFTYLVLRGKKHGITRGPAWNCGHPDVNPRMQYTSTSFSQPLRVILSNVYRPQEKTSVAHRGHKLLTDKVRHVLFIQDLAWRYLYLPIGKFVLGAAKRTDWITKRSIHVYLTYTFLTILVLLGFLT